MKELAAAITAGGRVGDEFALQIGTEVKALAPFAGRRLIDFALDAARGAGATRLAVVGPPEVHAYCGTRIDEAIDESPSGEENLRRALASAHEATLLLMTSDMPFVSAGGVHDFLERSAGSDVTMPLASAGDYEAAFPSAPDHVTTLAGERIANGNAFTFAAGSAARIVEVATRLFTARKSLLAMALLLGPNLLMKFATRRLRISDIEERAQQVFGLRARAVRDAAPGLCYDIDTQADYRYALERAAHG